MLAYPVLSCFAACFFSCALVLDHLNFPNVLFCPAIKVTLWLEAEHPKEKGIWEVLWWAFVLNLFSTAKLRQYYRTRWILSRFFCSKYVVTFAIAQISLRVMINPVLAFTPFDLFCLLGPSFRVSFVLVTEWACAALACSCALCAANYRLSLPVIATRLVGNGRLGRCADSTRTTCALQLFCIPPFRLICLECWKKNRKTDCFEIQESASFDWLIFKAPFR